MSRSQTKILSTDENRGGFLAKKKQKFITILRLSIRKFLSMSFSISFIYFNEKNLCNKVKAASPKTLACPRDSELIWKPDFDLRFPGRSPHKFLGSFLGNKKYHQHSKSAEGKCLWVFFTDVIGEARLLFWADPLIISQCYGKFVAWLYKTRTDNRQTPFQSVVPDDVCKGTPN